MSFPAVDGDGTAEEGTRLFRPAFQHHPRLRDLEVIDARDVLKDAVRGVVAGIHAKGKVGLGLHRAKSDWTGPRPALFISHVVASRSLLRLLRALPA